MKKSAKEHYDTHLAYFYSWMQGGFSPLRHRFRSYMVSHNIRPFASGLALDLGAGNGVQAAALADLGFAVTAVDNSRYLLEELKKNTVGLNVKAVEADLHEFVGLVNEKPELILCWGDTLTHLDSKTHVCELFQQAASALVPGGRFVLSFRDYTDAMVGQRRFIHVRSDDHRILTCILEYGTEHLDVTDIFYSKEAGGWKQAVSAYQKLRLLPSAILLQLGKAGLDIQASEVVQGVVIITAVKPQL